MVVVVIIFDTWWYTQMGYCDRKGFHGGFSNFETPITQNLPHGILAAKMWPLGFRLHEVLVRGIIRLAPFRRQVEEAGEEHRKHHNAQHAKDLNIIWDVDLTNPPPIFVPFPWIYPPTQIAIFWHIKVFSLGFSEPKNARILSSDWGVNPTHSTFEWKTVF